MEKYKNIICCFSDSVSASKTVPASDDNFLVSPITGEKIPADKMQEHMRIGKCALIVCLLQM